MSLDMSSLSTAPDFRAVEIKVALVLGPKALHHQGARNAQRIAVRWRYGTRQENCSSLFHGHQSNIKKRIKLRGEE